jgi:hypothetical protein
MNEDKIKDLFLEYIRLVEFLIDENLIYRFKDSNIAVERNILRKLLDKHSFFNVREKLKLWKILNFIITDNDLYTTKKMVIKNNERVRIRFYLLNMNTYKILKNVFNLQ